MNGENLRRFTLYALVVALLMIPVAYWTITQGGSYARAERFLSGHLAIERQIGRVTNIRLAFSGDNSAFFSAANDTAHLELVVTGDRGVGFATIDLRFERGAWDIMTVKFRREGEPVPVQTFPVDRRERRGILLVANPPRSLAPPPRTA